ncbi:MAG: hypothetical protein ACJAXW_004401 [Candidatus Azotimanducaceae bacterium]|jgi:hypothetical protein
MSARSSAITFARLRCCRYTDFADEMAVAMLSIDVIEGSSGLWQTKDLLTGQCCRAMVVVRYCDFRRQFQSLLQPSWTQRARAQKDPNR